MATDILGTCRLLDKGCCNLYQDRAVVGHVSRTVNQSFI